MSLDREHLLELGFVLFGSGVVIGLGLLIGGRLLGDSQHRLRHREPPPAPGAVPPGRHQQLGTSAR